MGTVQGGGWRERKSCKIGQHGDGTLSWVSREVTEIFKQKENTVVWILGREPVAIWTMERREMRLIHPTNPPHLQPPRHEFV